MIFDKLSPQTDFISKIQSDLKVLNGNVLYLTHEIDQIKIIVNKILLAGNLQKQVDEYFGHDDDHFPEDSKQEDRSQELG